MTKDDEAIHRLGTHLREERDAADAALAEKPEMTAPLGKDFEEAVVAKALANVAPAPKPIASASKVSILRRIGPWIGPVALAAAFVLVFTARGTGGDDGPVLPEYGVSARGDQTLRGPAPAAPTEALRVQTDTSTFELVVRPASATSGKVAAWVFTREESEDPVPLSGTVDVSAEGSVRIRSTGAMLGRAREIRVVVAPAARFKFDDAVARARSGASDEHVRVVVVPVDRR